MKSVFHRIAQWNLLVAGVAVSLAVASFALLGLPLHPPVLVVVGAGSFLIYTLDRRLPFSPEDGVPPKAMDPVAVAALVASPCAAAYACIYLTPAGRSVVAILAACSVAYILPVLPGRKRLKDVPYLKSMFVTFGWGAATVILPATQGGRVLEPSVGFLFAYRLLYLTPNALLADWPDREADRAAGIRTAANQLGEKGLFGRCLSMAITGAVIAGFSVWRGLLPWWVLTELPALLLLLLLARPPLPTDRRFYLLVADGLLGWPVVPALICYFALS